MIIKRALKMMSSNKELLKIFFAFCSFFSPKAIENKGAPPSPTKKAKEVMKVVIGATTPMPTSACWPFTGIFET